MFGETEFAAGTPISDIKYKYSKCQIKNLFYLFDNQLEYVLAHYFAKSENIKCNIDIFFYNLLIKPIIKNLSYYNADKWIEKLFAIL